MDYLKVSSYLSENEGGLLLEQCVSTEQEDWAAQAEEPLIRSPPNDVSFLPSSIIFIHSVCVLYIFRMFVSFFCWKSKCANVNHPSHWWTCMKSTTWRWRSDVSPKHHRFTKTGAVFLRLPTTTLFYCWTVLLFWRHCDCSVAVCVCRFLLCWTVNLLNL